MAPRSRRATLVAAVITTALFASGGPARATSVSGDVGSNPAGTVSTGITVTVSGSSSGPTGGATVQIGVREWVIYSVAHRFGDASQPNEGWCQGMRWQAVPQGVDSSDLRRRQEDAYKGRFLESGDLYGLDPNFPCPPGVGGGMTPAIAQAMVRELLHTEPLPRPSLDVPPGRAMVGMPAYLVTDHVLEHELAPRTLHVGLTSFSLSWQASGVSRVDWGDGTVTSHTVGGAAWPEGEVVHTYREDGTFDVSVTDTWTIDYRVGPITGRIVETLEPVVLRGLEVEQRQAIRITTSP